MKQTVSIELEIPEGYEATGEYRFPREREHFLLDTGNTHIGDGHE